MIASACVALSLFASTAMFVATAVALAFGLGVRRLPLGRLPLLCACVVVYSACALTVEAAAAPELAYLVSLALLLGASAAFALAFVRGPVLVRLVTVVSCVFSMIAARSVLTNVFDLYLNELLPSADVATLAFFVSLYVSCADADRLVAELTPPGGNRPDEEEEDEEAIEELEREEKAEERAEKESGERSGQKAGKSSEDAAAENRRNDWPGRA